MEEGAARQERSWQGGRVAETDAEDLRAVAGTLRGDRDAFRGIVDRHGALVLRLALSFLGNPEEAEEASQEIFFRAYRSLRSFRLERRFLPWLYALALNYLRTHYAARKRKERFVVHDSPEPAAAEATTDPGSLLEAAASRRELRRAIESLPETLRTVVSLYYVEAMSVSQIASMLGIGTENVKSRLHRGRKRLRTSFGPGATPGAPPE